MTEKDTPSCVVVDVDGVVSPVRGTTCWGDDVVAGNVFGPVHVSPAMCARLDELAGRQGLSCWWLTSWSAEMRAGMDPFPGRSWSSITEPRAGTRRRWWKLLALEAWLDLHPGVRSLAWCDDHLRAPARAGSVRRRLRERDVEALLIAPQTSVGLTPEDLRRLEAWART